MRAAAAVAFAIVSLAAGSAFAQTGLDGEWTGSGGVRLVLKVDGATLTGTVAESGIGGPPLTIDRGTVTGRSATFFTSRSPSGAGPSVRWMADLTDDDTLTLSRVSEPAGGEGRGARGAGRGERGGGRVRGGGPREGGAPPRGEGRGPRAGGAEGEGEAGQPGERAGGRGEGGTRGRSGEARGSRGEAPGRAGRAGAGRGGERGGASPFAEVLRRVR